MELPLADKSTAKFRRSDSTDRQFKSKKPERSRTLVLMVRVSF